MMMGALQDTGRAWLPSTDNYLVSTTSAFHLTKMELIQIEQHFTLVTNTSLFMWDRDKTFPGMQECCCDTSKAHRSTFFDIIGPNLGIDTAEEWTYYWIPYNLQTKSNHIYELH